ncbi:MAG: hypothetical protein AAF934_07570 [Bacteroidota bacterium]
MKKVTFIILLAVTLSFCSRTKDLNYGSYPQKWQLVKMSGNMAGPENVRTGDAMEWQEFYILKADGTFKKSRKQHGQVTEAGGTYSIKKQRNYKEFGIFPISRFI